MPAFECRYPGCNASYARKEHLNRHAARHSQQERFRCPHCDSTLVRSDLLRRHVRKYHPEKELEPSRAVKACRACHDRKERCDGGDPCNRCLQREVVCSRTGPSSQENLQETCQETNDEQRELPAWTAELADLVPDGSIWTAQSYIDFYFLYFHPTWPFVHQGSFDIFKEPCILIQSMLMIALWIKGDQETRDMAMTFHHRLLSQIQSQRRQWEIPGGSNTPWPMASFQGILLQLIFALMTNKEITFDLNLRCRLPDSEYELLVSLVQTCRRLGLFYYPNMITQHDSSAPITLIWLSMEETKRFGLALYKLSRLCSRRSDDRSGSIQDELLTLADLEFSMPESDAVWNAPSFSEVNAIRRAIGTQEMSLDRDSDNWISNASGKLRGADVGFDWV